MKKIVSFLLLTSLVPYYALAQAAHWQFDESVFQYDMRAYISLKANDADIVDLSNYDIAAFCGRECRGLVQSQRDIINPSGGREIATLIIKSNSPESQESITFKVYDKISGRVINVQNTTVSFMIDQTQGSVSNPFVLDITKRYTIGDVNADGEIDIDDVYLVIDICHGKTIESAIEEAADVNGDGFVEMNDAYLLIEKALGR